MMLLTPSMLKFPIIAHLVETMLVSGKIALSHAPSLPNSSARPCYVIHKHNPSFLVNVIKTTACFCIKQIK